MMLWVILLFMVVVLLLKVYDKNRVKREYFMDAKDMKTRLSLLRAKEEKEGKEKIAPFLSKARQSTFIFNGHRTFFAKGLSCFDVDNIDGLLFCHELKNYIVPRLLLLESLVFDVPDLTLLISRFFYRCFLICPLKKDHFVIVGRSGALKQKPMFSHVKAYV